MLKIKEVQAKSIVTKSNLPDSDLVINPYTGCMHGCIYCYARFMKRFTGHEESWGKFVDVKINAPDLIDKDMKKYKNEFITIGSVTDAYHPLERKYQLTKKILEKLLPYQPDFDILTKSDLILRDIDLLKKFKQLIIGVSLSVLDKNISKKLEPLASSPERRINTLKELRKNGIRTALFMSPMFPYLTDWKKIILMTKDFVDEYWFENLNLYASVKKEVYKFLSEIDKSLIKKYDGIYLEKNDYWENVRKEIIEFCKNNKVKYTIYFYYGGKKWN